MGRSLGFAIALVSAAPVLLLPPTVNASDRALPMHFELRVQGPADICGKACKLLISASGAITAETPRDFKLFAQGRDLTNATVVLDSDGGSVIGAIALGREVRRLGLSTMVGRTVDIKSTSDEKRATLSPRGDCESMCAFVMLGGVHRIVPPEAQVMVHQIWLGDRRDDPTAANYSAEDLVLVQRDIGRLAQFTVEMGASIDLLDLALRIPPWEPMHALTAEELRQTKLSTDDGVKPAEATIAAAPPAAVSLPVPRTTDGVRATRNSEQRWAMVDRAGVATLARHHPLTVEGEDIGSFDLTVSCGADGENYDVSYIERRHGAERMDVPDSLDTVNLRLVNSSTRLKVVSSERRKAPDELVTYATATIPAARIGRFASAGNHSMLIETQSDGMVTVIRLGNTGAQPSMPQLAASCIKGSVNRAELPIKRTGGYAAAQ
jgi:hypothetical protein